MPKQNKQQKKEVTVPVIWFENLIKLAIMVEKEKPGNYKYYDPFFHEVLPNLLGYISSAESIISLPLTKKSK